MNTAPVVEAWQPIDTAPKGGDPIDLWGAERERYENSRISDCWWCAERQTWVHLRTIFDDENDDDVALVYNATHWRHRPGPPGEQP